MAQNYSRALQSGYETVRKTGLLTNRHILEIQETIVLVTQIRELMQDYKTRIRDEFKFYSHDLLNNLFSHPYTKIEFLEQVLQIHRQTASKYLEDLVHAGFLRLEKIGKHNFYINEPLFNIFAGEKSG